MCCSLLQSVAVCRELPTHVLNTALAQCVCVCVRAYVCAHVCVLEHVCYKNNVYTCKCANMCVYTPVHLCVYVCVGVCMCV